MLHVLQQTQWYEWQLTAGLLLMILGGGAETALLLKLGRAAKSHQELTFYIRSLAYGFLAFLLGGVLTILAIIQNPPVTL